MANKELLVIVSLIRKSKWIRQQNSTCQFRIRSKGKGSCSKKPNKFQNQIEKEVGGMHRQEH